MNKLALLLPILALAACSKSEPAPAPQPTAAAAPKSKLPAPDIAHFSAAFAEVCKDAPKVNKVDCKRAGMGSEDVLCDYALGDDEYLRHKATLNPNAAGDGWVLADADKTCAEHGAETK